MKKLFIIMIIITFSLDVMAQQPKKVAVWETKCSDNSITPFQSIMVRGGMETAVANAPGYTGYDRAAFDAIVKEQNFQRSGAVSDSEIRRLGIMAGVQYIIVPEASASGNDFYIIVKMLDVETGEYSTAYDALCTASSSDIKQTCIQLGAQLFRDTYTHLGDNSNTVHGQDFTETALGINMRMIYVEGGMFNMGCTNEQNDCEDDEKNVRRVVLDGYYIGMLEVTQSQWEKVMGKNIYKHVDELRDDYSFVVDSSNWEVWVDMFDWVKPGDTVWPSPFCSDGEHLRISAAGPNYPMYLVTWYDAVSFCEKLSEKTGKKYMLPTEAQWEYAARGGNRATGMLYAGSNSIEEVAWYRGNSKDVLHYCGTLLPNALGIYDMSGNVLEWCRDLYSERYLSYDTNNPTGPEKDEGEMYPYYVIRGGDVSSDAKYCRITNRDYCVAQGFNGGIGFRVVCIP